MKAFKKILTLCLVVFLVVACLPISGVMAAGDPAQKEDGDITIPITPGDPLPPEEEETDVTDLDVDGDTDTDDAVYLLLNVMFGATDYPLPLGVEPDYDSSGNVDTDDAVYLLLHVMFGEEDYPLFP